MLHQISEYFKQKHGEIDAVIFAPGRANIIGEHTDYNDGFVLPFPINLGLWFVAQKNQVQHLKIEAFNIQETIDYPLKTDQNIKSSWFVYFYQVLQRIQLPTSFGATIVFGGNLPIGAGVSSSSAITCGFIALLNRLYELQLASERMLEIAVLSERGGGVQGGIMDQFTIFYGLKNKAIFLHCGDKTYEYIDINLGGLKFYLIHTNIKHELALSDYNNRRADCELALNHLQSHGIEITSLSHLSINQLSWIQEILPQALYEKTSYVIEENQRAVEATKALKSGDFNHLGRLLYQSHKGLSEKYQVSCPQLDWLVNMANQNDFFLGARMMGGGFGGCTINLVKGLMTDTMSEDIKQKYFEQFNIKPEIYLIESSDGLLESEKKIHL